MLHKYSNKIIIRHLITVHVFQLNKHTVACTWVMSMIPLSQTVGKFEHDRKCQPWWSFHQGEGKHLVKVTLLSADTNSRTGKSRLDSGCGRDELPTNNNHVIADYYLTPTWLGPPPTVPTRTDDMSHTVGYGNETTHLGSQRSWMRLTWSCSFVHGSGYDLHLSSQRQGQTSLGYLSFPSGTQQWNRGICLQW